MARYLCTQACLPFLKKSGERQRNPHILTLSPPLNSERALVCAACGRHDGQVRHEHVRTGMQKSLVVRNCGQRAVAAHGDPDRGFADDSGHQAEHCRTPEIMADAAYQVLIADAKTTTGNFFIDDEVLERAGITDLGRYSVVPRKSAVGARPVPVVDWSIAQRFAIFTGALAPKALCPRFFRPTHRVLAQACVRFHQQVAAQPDRCDLRLIAYLPHSWCAWSLLARLMARQSPIRFWMRSSSARARCARLYVDRSWARVEYCS